MSKPTLLAEFWDFLKARKWWWLTPLVITLILVGLLLAFSDSSAPSPFVYSLY